MNICIVLAEDNFLVREGVRQLLRNEPDFEVVAVCSDFDELIEAIDAHQPNVVLTDIRMPPHRIDEGIRAAEHCFLKYPDIGVVLLSQYVEPEYVRILLAQGTQRRGYLLKESVADADELAASVREVADGGSAIDPKVVEVLVGVGAGSGQKHLSRLTPRETEVLAAMARGKNNATIAADLVLSQRAVEKHINAIFAKLGLSGDQQGHPRVRAVLLYLTGENAGSQ